MDYAKINEAAMGYKDDMTKFLRDLVRIPGESCGEKGHIMRIKEEMEKVGFDKVQIDPMGNILGYMGTGKTLIGFDAHIDTVGIGNIKNWEFDPYEGFESDEEIGGRGTSDQMGGIVSAVYGAKIMKDLGLLNDKYQVLVTGTVQEEDCDGLCWQYIIHEDGVRPEFVVSTEPTDGGIYRGQRGRMEIRVDVKGVSCHGSAPERGDNAIYKMEPFAGVDPIAVEDIQSIVIKLKEKNIGILITDHNVYETLSICDRAYLLFEGKVLFQGTAEQLAENEIVREKYLGKDFVLRKKDF